MGEFVKKAKKMMKDGMRGMEKEGYKKGPYDKSQLPKRPRIDSNPIVQLFNKVPVFRKIFHDPELEFIDPFATVMFFISSVMLVMCAPFSLVSSPYCARVRRLGRVGTWILAVLDCALRTCIVFASLFYLWIPVNKFAHAYVTARQKYPLKEYLKDPENFQPMITNDPSSMVFVSYVLSGFCMSVALLRVVKHLQTQLADDPEQLVKDMEDVRRKHMEATRKGSGDMPEKTKEDGQQETVRARKTPIRSCRLRSSFGRDPTEHAK